MNMSLKNSYSGFTLVETLVSVVLFTILWGAVFLIYLSGSESWQVNSVRLELHQEVRKAVARITEDLRETGPGAITDVPDDGNWYPDITFRKASGISNGNMVWASNTTNYSVGGPNADRLIELTGISTTSVAALNITNVQFRRLAGVTDLVEVTITATKDTFRGRALTVNMNFEIHLRNG